MAELPMHVGQGALGTASVAVCGSSGVVLLLHLGGGQARFSRSRSA